MEKGRETRREETSTSRLTSLRADWRRLERRDWWLWWIAILVMQLLVGAVLAVSLPAFVPGRDFFFQFHLGQAIRGLLGMILLFDAYIVFQQVRIKRLRRLLSAQVEEMTRLEAKAEEYHELAALDPLTGLYNRRMADDRLAAEVARSQRYGHPLCVLSFDLDNFKPINDRHGHAAGDLVLKEFARRLKSAIRASDLAARTGGDEFVALLMECRPESVNQVLERLRPVHVRIGSEMVLATFSAGWADFRPGDRPQDLLERADEALYMGKRAGRSAVTEPAASVAGPPLPQWFA